MNPAELNKRKSDVTIIMSKMGVKKPQEESSGMEMENESTSGTSMRADALKAFAAAIQNGNWKRADMALATWLDLKDEGEDEDVDMEDVCGM
jgi:hypothetical protein